MLLYFNVELKDGKKVDGDNITLEVTVYPNLKIKFIFLSCVWLELLTLGHNFIVHV